MTTIYPALRGVFGTTTYYIVTMRVSELVGRVQLPSEMPKWEDLSIDTKYQRDIDILRIKRHMAPYFAEDERRFSGSLVTAVKGLTDEGFEGLSDIMVKPLPVAYRMTTRDIGFLTLGDHKLIPLDGQHRAKAFQMALEQKNSGLADDKISVIIMGFNESLSRYIFNKINKYARPTSKAGKLITDDDDAMASITRGMITNEVIPIRLVNTKSNSLTKKSPEFTLLSTLYDANRALLSIMPVPVVGRPENMNIKEREKNQRDMAGEWKRLINGITQWRRALANPDERGDKTRIKIRERSILGKPIGQLSLVRGYVHACCNMERMDRDEIVRKLDKINWDVNHTQWRGLLVRPDGRMMYGSRVATNASKVIAHLVGVHLPKTTVDKILDYMYGATRLTNKRLPSPIN
ncbi:MAG: DGQHR domain-containing protein [Cenarchaeum sp. SB0661_bin_35]|nr:DGQHR domain-containing protein [Cenarchaeum sp. SB0661_bin_35]